MNEGGADAQKALEACQKGMDIVGKLFEDGEYFVGDLIYAGELMTKAVDILKDALITGDGSGDKKTKMILCLSLIHIYRLQARSRQTHNVRWQNYIQM